MRNQEPPHLPVNRLTLGQSVPQQPKYVLRVTEAKVLLEIR